MSMLITEKNFKEKFKEISFQNKRRLIEKLESVIDLPQGHYTHTVLNRYYRKYPVVMLDREMAKNILFSYFNKGGTFIVDYDELYQGGYPRIEQVKINEDESYVDLRYIDIINSNWYNYIDKIKSIYWGNEKHCNRFLSLKVYNFFEERMPVDAREAYLSSGQELNINGTLKKNIYKFFDIEEVNKYYISLIEEFYPEFKLIKKLSNKKIKRFGKEIGNNTYLGLYVDFSVVDEGLKKTYLELPKMKIEIFSKYLDSNIEEKCYLKGQDDFPIARINYSYFIGNPVDSRIGTSADNEDSLKRNLFFFSDVYAFYLGIYLQSIEEDVLQTMQICSSS